MSNTIDWDDPNVLRTLPDGWYSVPADSGYAKKMKSDPWLKEGDTRKLAEERHKDNQSASTSVCEYRNKICNHEYTFKSSGWKICVTCGSYLRRIFSHDLSFYSSGYSFNNVKKDKRKEIRDKNE